MKKLQEMKKLKKMDLPASECDDCKVKKENKLLKQRLKDYKNLEELINECGKK